MNAQPDDNKIIQIKEYQKNSTQAKVTSVLKRLKTIRNLSLGLGTLSGALALGSQRWSLGRWAGSTAGTCAFLAFGTAVTSQTLLNLNRQLEDNLNKKP